MGQNPAEHTKMQTQAAVWEPGRPVRPGPHSLPQAAVITVSSSVCGSSLFNVPDTTSDGLAPSGTWEGSRGSSQLLVLGVPAVSPCLPLRTPLCTPQSSLPQAPHNPFTRPWPTFSTAPLYNYPQMPPLSRPLHNSETLTSLQTTALCLRRTPWWPASVSHASPHGHVRLHPQQPSCRPGEGASSKANLSSPGLLPLRTDAIIPLPSGPFLQPINTLVSRFL